MDYQGSRENSIISLDLNHGSIFKDPSAEPERRFKCILGAGKYDYVAGKLAVGHGSGTTKILQKHGIMAALGGVYSPDGIRWTPCEKLIMPWYTDTRNVAFWDDRIQK